MVNHWNGNLVVGKSEKGGSKQVGFPNDTKEQGPENWKYVDEHDRVAFAERSGNQKKKTLPTTATGRGGKGGKGGG